MALSGLSTDAVIDRRKLKRRITFWRIAALLLLSATTLAVLSAAGFFEGLGKKSLDHVAEVEISGVITNDQPMIELLGDLGDNDAVKGVILNISSPGGSTVGGEALFEAVLSLREKKPVVTSVGTLAASAGYMIAAASERIFVRRSSIVGSIGVIFQYGEVSKLLDKIGVEMNEVKSAPLKAEPSPFHPTSPEAREMIENVVADTYQWFIDIVAEQRGFTPLKARGLADGSIFTGSQGLENGLVDEIGDKYAAKAWLVAEKDVPEDSEILEWEPKRSSGDLLAANSGWASAVIGFVARSLGLDFAPVGTGIIRGALPERLFLDGLISMLHIGNTARDAATIR